jgi:glutamate-1-semialdehyde aminotransferase
MLKTEKSWIGCTANWNKPGPDEDFWIIRDADQEELARFPYNMGEHGVMAVVHSVRALEKAAWEAGKEFGSQAMMAAGRQKLQEMADAYNKLDAHNTYLADKLEDLIGDKG